MAELYPTHQPYKASCCARMRLSTIILGVFILFIMAAGIYVVFLFAFNNVKSEERRVSGAVLHSVKQVK